MSRDEIMQIANDTAGAYWMDEAHIQRFAAALLAAGAAAEREACAKVCESDDSLAGDWLSEICVGNYFAELIRARGQK